jgi:hypothetical protein
LRNHDTNQNGALLRAAESYKAALLLCVRQLSKWWHMTMSPSHRLLGYGQELGIGFTTLLRQYNDHELHKLLERDHGGYCVSIPQMPTDKLRVHAGYMWACTFGSIAMQVMTHECMRNTKELSSRFRETASSKSLAHGAGPCRLPRPTSGRLVPVRLGWCPKSLHQPIASTFQIFPLVTSR